MNDELKYKNDNMTKEESAQLRKNQRTGRIVGLALFVIHFPFYPLLIKSDMPALALLVVFGETIGLILFIRSFVAGKYASLKYVEFDKNKKNKINPHRNIKSKTTSVSGKKDKNKIADSVTAESGPDKSENNRILGCMLGGAAGDALGYTVEFLNYDRIIKQYGQNGITSYSVDPATSKAIVSDDTQMTLFTAEGLLRQDGDDITNICRSYQNWLITQQTSFENRPQNNDSELMNRPELFARRAPGNTCLSALSSGLTGTVTNPINSSKGCGGIMRVAPIAFINYYSVLKLDKLAAQAAAITHGHPLGYLPAALLVHILHKAIYENSEGRTLLDIINSSVREFTALFSSAPYFNDLLTIVNKAIGLSGNKLKDIDNIRELGEGWVAEETLAIAIYSALRHHDDFSAAIVASVNHDGDSDSTGAVTGNILGAYLGEAKIDAGWKEHLEMYDLISKTAAGFRS